MKKGCALWSRVAASWPPTVVAWSRPQSPYPRDCGAGRHVRRCLPQLIVGLFTGAGDGGRLSAACRLPSSRAAPEAVSGPIGPTSARSRRVSKAVSPLAATSTIRGRAVRWLRRCAGVIDSSRGSVRARWTIRSAEDRYFRREYPRRSLPAERKLRSNKCRTACLGRQRDAGRRVSCAIRRMRLPGAPTLADRLIRRALCRSVSRHAHGRGRRTGGFTPAGSTISTDLLATWRPSGTARGEPRGISA